MEVIRTTGLGKFYGEKKAVDDLNMLVRKGDIYGFIGRNGSGKSTTLKMICGLAKPSTGEIQIFHKPVSDSVVRRRTGMLIENPGIYPEFSARENMMLKAKCLGLMDGDHNVDELLKVTELDKTGKKKTKNFSMGMKQRLGIAMALLGKPDLLILDEPINGLDPEGILQVRNLLIRLNQEKGMTIVISSHILGELSKIATRYGIIKEGHLAEEISAVDLDKKRKDYLHLRVDNPKKAAILLEENCKIHSYEVRPQGEIRIYGDADSGLLSGIFAENGVQVQELFRHQQDLEGYFLELMGGEEHV